MLSTPPASLLSPSFSPPAAAAKSLQSCPTLCDPIDGNPSGCPVPGILQARTLEWVAISFSNAWKRKVKVKSRNHIRLSDPMDCSPPGSSVHGIFQARVLTLPLGIWNCYSNWLDSRTLMGSCLIVGRSFGGLKGTHPGAHFQFFCSVLCDQ